MESRKRLRVVYTGRAQGLIFLAKICQWVEPALVRVSTATYRSGTRRFKALKAAMGGAAGEFLHNSLAWGKPSWDKRSAIELRAEWLCSDRGIYKVFSAQIAYCCNDLHTNWFCWITNTTSLIAANIIQFEHVFILRGVQTEINATQLKVSGGFAYCLCAVRNRACTLFCWPHAYVTNKRRQAKA